MIGQYRNPQGTDLLLNLAVRFADLHVPGDSFSIVRNTQYNGDVARAAWQR
jgi:hypothetical protein